MKKLLALMLAGMLLLTMMTGCGNSNTDENAYQVIRYGLAYDADVLDPQNCYDDGSYTVLNNISEGLLVGYDGEVHPGIAETWEVSDDGLVYTFHLRESTWSDGTPLTAQDFVYSAKRALDPNGAYEQAESFWTFKNGEEYYKGECTFEEVGVKALDDYTLEYTMKHPKATFLYDLAGFCYFPVNQNACETYGKTYGAEADQILTNGPFTCTEWTHSSKFVLKKNENYWNADNVKIDEVQFIIGASGQVAVDLFMAEDLDAGLFYDEEDIKTLTDMGLSSDAQISSYNFIHLNCAGSTEKTAPFMSNVNFRKALSCAISREDIMRVGNDVGEAADRITPPSLLAADGRSFSEEYPLKGWSTAAEPEKAKEYLNAALKEIGADLEEVPTLSMVCYDSQTNLDKLQAVQDMIYQTLGISCQINPQPIQQMLDMVANGEYDLSIGGKGMEVPDWANQVATEYTGRRGNITNYDNPAFVKLYDELDVAVNMQKRNDLLFEMEKMIVEDMATLHLFWGEDYTISVPDLTGIQQLNGYGPWFAMCEYTK